MLIRLRTLEIIDVNCILTTMFQVFLFLTFLKKKLSIMTNDKEILQKKPLKITF